MHRQETQLLHCSHAYVHIFAHPPRGCGKGAWRRHVDAMMNDMPLSIAPALTSRRPAWQAAAPSAPPRPVPPARTSLAAQTAARRRPPSPPPSLPAPSQAAPRPQTPARLAAAPAPAPAAEGSPCPAEVAWTRCRRGGCRRCGGSAEWRRRRGRRHHRLSWVGRRRRLPSGAARRRPPQPPPHRRRTRRRRRQGPPPGGCGGWVYGSGGLGDVCGGAVAGWGCRGPQGVGHSAQRAAWLLGRSGLWMSVGLWEGLEQQATQGKPWKVSPVLLILLCRHPCVSKAVP